ncbi:hypothetical protein NECAME_03422 [Necator americanus]|uniref:G-protein coupled receptors family 1 profile domain-containing protein n=1 Tax=Necator americanus TaxID=51031 RepID=W2T5L7_NECAM|nr:hypothetical protein NECAME_03422 [Necator americanus]ETN76491.1 hypothetical protein NECAME_03422 [Necator americanus]
MWGILYREMAECAFKTDLHIICARYPICDSIHNNDHLLSSGIDLRVEIVTSPFTFLCQHRFLVKRYREIISHVFSFLRRRAKSRLTSIAQQANLLYVVAATAGGDTQQHKEQLTHLIEQKKRVMQQRRRVTLILVSMVVIFGITSLPHNIVSTLMEFTDSQDLLAYNGNDYTYLLNLITHFLAMLSCIANPLLYAFLNPEFRELILNGLAGIKWAPRFVSRTWQPTQTTVV